MDEIYVTDQKWIAETLSEQVAKEDIFIIGSDYLLNTDNSGYPLFTIHITERKSINIHFTHTKVELIKKIKEKITQNSSIVNVCSCNEDGQLNFNMLIIALGIRKEQAKRIWFNERAEINTLKTEPNSKYDSLAAALLCEKVIDLYWKQNSFKLFNCSVPISYKELYILLHLHQRENKIKAQENSTGYKIHIEVSKDTFKWYRKNGGAGAVDKIDTLEEAIKKKDSIKESKLLITSNRRRITEKEHPLLLNNTDIYRFAKKNDLGTVEEIKKALAYLYQNGYITNPDTQSRYLPRRIINDVISIVKAVKPLPEIRPYIEYLKKTYETINFSKCSLFNDTMCENSHAIIPTEKGIIDSGISGIEIALYLEIARRFISVLFPLQKKETYNIIGMIDTSNYARLDIENIIEYGWSIIDYAPEDLEELSEEKSVPVNKVQRYSPGSVLDIDEIVIAPSIPRTVKRYTLHQLLNIIEYNGRTIRDQKKKARETEKSMGVKTDKSYILSSMISKELIKEKDKFVMLTEKGHTVIDSLPTSLHKQRVLQEMNLKLKHVREGKLTFREAITSHLKVLERCISESYQLKYMKKTDYSIVSKLLCPFCSSSLEEKMKYIACTKCSFAIRKIVFGYTLSAEDIEQLVTTGETRTISGFITKKDNNASGKIVLDNRYRNIKVII